MHEVKARHQKLILLRGDQMMKCTNIKRHTINLKKTLFVQYLNNIRSLTVHTKYKQYSVHHSMATKRIPEEGDELVKNSPTGKI